MQKNLLCNDLNKRRIDSVLFTFVIDINVIQVIH